MRIGAYRNIARAGSNMIGAKSYLYVKEARKSFDDLPTGLEGAVSRLERNGNICTPHPYGNLSEGRSGKEAA